MKSFLIVCIFTLTSFVVGFCPQCIYSGHGGRIQYNAIALVMESWKPGARLSVFVDN